MTENSSVLLVYSPRFLEHNAEIEHIETPERLVATLDVLEKLKILDCLEIVSPRPASRGEVLAVHTEAHLASLARAARGGGGYLDPDTHVSPPSEEVAFLAAGAVLTALDEIFSGRTSKAFCLLRPPGHHALPARGMGFCLLNNLAIGAKYAQLKKGISRILIVDWDAHHGNGLQDVFYDDGDVLYISLHQYPHYPGTGHLDEVGNKNGRGFTVNFPFPPGTDGKSYHRAFEQIILPIGERFKPELVMVAAGYDGHFADPLSGLRLSSNDFSMMSGYLSRLAGEFAGGRLIVSLEGGYNLKSLSHSIARTLIELGELEISAEDPFQIHSAGGCDPRAAQHVLDAVKEVQSQFWPL